VREKRSLRYSVRIGEGRLTSSSSSSSNLPLRTTGAGLESLSSSSAAIVRFRFAVKSLFGGYAHVPQAAILC